MKIAFIISSINSKSGGLGGHFYSMLEIASQMVKKHSVIVVIISNNQVKALENSRFKSYSILKNGPALFEIHRQLKQIIDKEKPDVLHAFDGNAYYWVRTAGMKLNIPGCLTKCGGVNQIYFPYADNFILFSSENYEYYSSKRKYKKTKFHLIPNRIRQFEDDYVRIDKIKNELGSYKDSFKFLRITRIGRFYHQSSIQLVNLVKQLNADGVNCCAIFIGSVEDNDCLKELKEKSSNNIYFFTEEEYLKDAKLQIGVADAVLGTGRSFMEAAAKSKILLCPVQNSKIPLLITEENFKQAFFYNFSERIILDSYDEAANYMSIKNTILNKTELQTKQDYSYFLFNEYFNSDKVLPLYEKVYSELTLKPVKKHFDLLLHTLYILREYYRG